MPHAPPLQGGKGSIWVCLSPPRACSTWAPTLCVSTCGACEHLTVSHAWSPGQEARDLGPGNDPRTYSKSLPTCCRAFSTLFPNLPRKTFLTASDTLSACVFLRLQPVLSFLLEDVSSHGHRLPDLQKCDFIPSSVLHQSLENSHPAQTSLGRVSGTGYRTILCPPPSPPQPLELDSIELNVWLMQLHGDPCHMRSL